MASSTFLLKRLPLCSQTGKLSRSSYPAFTALQQGWSRTHIRPSASLYSTHATADLDRTNKPYYITTPIFYVNAGTARVPLDVCPCNVIAVNLIRVVIHSRMLIAFIFRADNSTPHWAFAFGGPRRYFQEIPRDEGQKGDSEHRNRRTWIEGESLTLRYLTHQSDLFLD